MPSELLILSREWGQPEAKLTIGEISIWRYLTYNIKNIIFFRRARVLGQIKCGIQEKMWAVTQLWVDYVRNHPEYQKNLKNYISDIIDHKLRYGMTREEVCLAWGNPVSISTPRLLSLSKEEWTYQKKPYQKTILTFYNGILINPE